MSSINDGGKGEKVGRGVNYLADSKKRKGNPWKKIRVVEIMDMLHDDLVLLAEDNYIGNTQTLMQINAF